MKLLYLLFVAALWSAPLGVLAADEASPPESGAETDTPKAEGCGDDEDDVDPPGGEGEQTQGEEGE